MGEQTYDLALDWPRLLAHAELTPLLAKLGWTLKHEDRLGELFVATALGRPFPQGKAALTTAGADATALLDQANIPLDRAWSEVQFRIVGDEHIPVPGMPDSLGFSVISSSLVDDSGYSNIRAGNSHIQAVTWDAGDPCPRAYTLLTYSQSTDPASPHYADQTRLYAAGMWNEMPFCEADVLAGAISNETIVGP